MERSTIFHGKIHERVRFTKYLKYLVGITWEGLGEILERLKLYEGLKKHNEKIWTVWRWWIHFLKMINHPIFIVFVGPMMFGFQRWDGWPYHIDEMATWFACRWSAGSLVCNQPLGKKRVVNGLKPSKWDTPKQLDIWSDIRPDPPWFSFIHSGGCFKAISVMKLPTGDGEKTIHPMVK